MSSLKWLLSWSVSKLLFLPGTYSRLRVSFIFDRDSGFYFLQIFFPASLVVVLSWVSHWLSFTVSLFFFRSHSGSIVTLLPREHSSALWQCWLKPIWWPAQTVDFRQLLMLKQSTCSSDSAICLSSWRWLSTPVLHIQKFAIRPRQPSNVPMFQKKNEDRRRREKKMEHKPAPPTPDILHGIHWMSYWTWPSFSFFPDVRLAECTCNAAPTSIIAVIKQPSRFCIRHSHIDIVSRAAFPLVVSSSVFQRSVELIQFIVFNIVFWVMLLYKSKRLPYISEHEDDRCEAPELH